MRKAIKEWGAEGWALIGKPPHVRVVVLVAKKLASPKAHASTITLPKSLGGRALKVAVRALHRDESSSTTSGSTLPSGGAQYLAPGAPISCDGDRIGIGAVVAIGGSPHIVTCGHAVGSGDTLATSDGDTEIATLRNNFFTSGDRLDAAVFKVNSDGLDLLRQGASAPTWASTIHAPDAVDNESEVTFWPTWADHKSSFVEDVLSFSACIPDGVGCGYVMLTRCTNLGDSGSTLQIDGSYYALASQRDGNNSFFTPISSVVSRLRSSGATAVPWRP